jgi:phosphoribosylformylglycinamidine synthase
VEACLISDLGCRVTLDGDPFIQLFSESSARVLAAVPAADELRFLELCASKGLPAHRLGVVDPLFGTLEIEGIATLSLDELRAAWEGTLPALFG